MGGGGFPIQAVVPQHGVRLWPKYLVSISMFSYAMVTGREKGKKISSLRSTIVSNIPQVPRGDVTKTGADERDAEASSDCHERNGQDDERDDLYDLICASAIGFA